MKKKCHDHTGIASNTDECFGTFIGCTVKGILPGGWWGNQYAAYTLIFDCGYGLSIGKTGSFWVVSPEDVQNGVDSRREELTKVKKQLAGVVSLAGD